ncbi:MAG TPA: septation protein A [Planctomycetes bacterium]|nr:septation protein A [Planctomycetota bacterium]
MPSPQPKPASKLLTEFGPLLLFFLTNKLWGIFAATGVFIVATVIAAAVAKRRDGRVPPMTLFTLVIVLVFGGLTIWLHDETFIKLKVTILNVLFGSILLFGLATGRNFLEALMGEAFSLTQRGWKLLGIRYAALFFFLAALNEVVWRNVSTDTWVNFKVFGLLGITMLFTILQVPLLQRHALEAAEEPVKKDP